MGRYPPIPRTRSSPDRVAAIRGEDMDAMSKITIEEEMGYADGGLAISIGVASLPFSMAAMFPMPKF